MEVVRDMNYDKWPMKPMSVSRLKLDPANPRFGTAMKRPSQPELLEDLLRHERVMDLVEDIARAGFYPNEPLVVTTENSNTIVLEGNRRLAALKLLTNPNLAPLEFRKRIQRSAAQSHGIPKKVRVVVAPTRHDAVSLIVARHNGRAIESWSPVQQARFVVSRLDEGLSIDEVARETNLERSEVVKARRDAKLYDVIRSLELPDDVRSVVDDPRQLNFTTLRRLIDSSAVQSHLGMTTDAGSGFTTNLRPEEFQSAMKKIVTDVAKGNVTSRNTNTAEQVREYLSSIPKKRKSRASGRSKGSTVTADQLIDPARLAPATKRRPARSRAPKSPSIALIPKQFRIDIDDDRICAIAKELKDLRVERYPNSVAITFRSWLDMALTRYLSEIGELDECKKRLAAKKTLRPDYVPTTRQQIDHILETASIPLNPEARKALKKFSNDARATLSLESLHNFTHNRYTPPTAEELRKYWTMLRAVFELTLQQSEAEVKGGRK